VRRKIKELFDVNVSLTTVSNYLHELNLSIQLGGSRPLPANFSGQLYVLGYCNCLLEMHGTGFFTCPPEELGCIDFFTDSEKHHRSKTINMVGMRQRHLYEGEKRYTSSFVVCTWYDDDNWTPALAFTHNPAFNHEVPDSRVQDLCDIYGVARNRIYYEKSEKVYCKESYAQVAEFCRLYGDMLKDAHMICDAGNSYKKNGRLIFDEACARSYVLPPRQHGELSVCDNKFNAIVKQLWRAHRAKPIDQVRDVIELLHWCDYVEGKSIASTFRRNFFLDGRDLSLDSVRAELESKSEQGAHSEALRLRYKEAYFNFMREHE
jgi:hypothetical protein